MRKHCMVFLFLISIVIQAQASTSLGWASPYFLPPGQAQTSLVEWESYSGHMFGYDNVIIVRLRFDSQAIDTFKYKPIGALARGFGLEVDVVECSNSPRLALDRINTTFPNSSHPVLDTNAFDSVTTGACSNGQGTKVLGLLVRNPADLEAEKDYYVHYVLKNRIPDSGTTVHLTLQVSWDINVVVSPFMEAVSDMYGSSLADDFDDWDYFNVESSPYRDFTLYPTNNAGVCWSGKGSSQGCTVSQNACYANATPATKWFSFFVSDAYASSCSGLTGTSSAAIRTGILPLPASPSSGSTTPPISGSNGSADLPNLTMRDVYLLDANKNKVPSIHVNKNFYCHMNVKNTGEKKANGTFENRCWVSKGNKFDGFGGSNDAEDIGKEDMDDLDNGYSRSSDEDSTGIEWPGTYNLVGCTDASKKVMESNEKDNCNVGDHAVIQEFVFQIVSDPNLKTTAISLTGSTTNPNINQPFGISSTTANPGENFGPDYVYIGYFIDGALVGQNQIRRGNMKGGMSKTEEISVSGGIATAGIHEVKACADYNNGITEINETDNCAVLLVTVNDPNAPPPNPDPDPTPSPTPPPPMSQSDDDDLFLMLLLD